MKFSARASKISTFEFSKKMDFFLRGVEGQKFLQKCTQHPPRTKTFAAIFHHHGARAHKIFEVHATLRAYFIYLKIGHFFNFCNSLKNQTEKSLRAQYWGGSRQNFLQKSRGVHVKSARSKSQLIIPKIEKVKGGFEGVHKSVLPLLLAQLVSRKKGHWKPTFLFAGNSFNLKMKLIWIWEIWRWRM